MSNNPLHLLLVEDDPSLRDPLAKRLKEKYSYLVDVTKSAKGTGD